MAAPRTLKVAAPHMTGEDVAAWQRTINVQFDSMGIGYRVEVDGDYGVTTRSATATLLYALGIAQDAMDEGVTPFLRVKVRDRKLSATERARMAQRTGWRRRLRAKHEAGGVAAPLAKILTHANGYSGGHDGVDLICPEDSPGFAICRAKVVRADNGGWWGKGAPSPAVAAKGDGILVLQALIDVGPIRKGMLFGYGHAEGMRVSVGDTVKAGQHVCRAGYANAPHFHWMVNSGGAPFWDGRRPRGVGDRDPWPILSYCIRNA